MKGLVYKSTGSWYNVKSENDKLIKCKIKGKLRLENINSTNPIAVGDFVEYEIQMDDFRDEQEDFIKAQRRELDDKYYALEDEIDNIEDAFEDEFEKQLRALDDSRESLMNEKMAPLEAQAEELDTQIEEKFVALDSLYQQQATLRDQLETLEKQVRDLDRQAEFGVLEVITGAIQNAEELEKGGGIGFESFIPSIRIYSIVILRLPVCLDK